MKSPSAKSLLAALLVTGLISTSCVTTPQISRIEADLPRIKGVQVLVLRANDLEGMREEISEYRAAGFDTVILRAFHLPGDRVHGPVRLESGVEPGALDGIYFRSEQAPLVMDLVTSLVKICHEQNMKAWAWMVTRKAGFSNAGLPTDVDFSVAEGRFYPTTDLDILNPAVQPYLEALFSDLARTGVDGILLQDDMVSRMGQGFTRSNLTNYRKDTGDTYPPYRYLETITGNNGRTYLKARPGFTRWIRWKTSRIVSLARSLEMAARSVNPGIHLALNQTYEAVTDPENGKLWLSQDLRQALEDGPSYAALMLYHRQIQDELGVRFSDVLELVDDSLSGLAGRLEQRSRVVLKFQTRDWKTGEPVPPEDLLSALLTAWGKGWSVALVPPPVEDQLHGVATILNEM